MPQLIETIAGLRACLAEPKRSALRIGLVPTMGALHRGHGALMEQARGECDRVVVSIFVNPTQFNDRSDFERYQRDLPADLAFCTNHQVDLVFSPSVLEMYGEASRLATSVEVAGVSDHLCGPFRPGHFRGVATVVTKLLSIAGADRAYFGQKDAQQLAVVRTLVQDLNIPTEIVAVPTVRENDGLALSSRNARLDAYERAIAPMIFGALQAAAARSHETHDVEQVREAGLQHLRGEPALRVEYFDVVHAGTMQPIVGEISGPVCIATACWLGGTRLIDNVLVAATSISSAREQTLV